MWIIFSKKEEQQISSIVIKEEELSYTYKNYIWKGKNKKCLICNTDDSYCEHYHYTLCKRVHLKDHAYKMRSSQQCKCLEPNNSSKREEKDTY